MLSAILHSALKYENPTLDEFRRLSKVRISLIRNLIGGQSKNGQSKSKIGF